MEESEIAQQTELWRKFSCDIGMVKVDAGDDTQVRVIESRRAENPAVLADAGPDPIAGHVERVREHGLLPRLESDVRSPEPGIGEGLIHLDLEFIIVGRLSVLMEGQELAAGNQRRFGGRQARGKRKAGGEQEESKRRAAAPGLHLPKGPRHLGMPEVGSRNSRRTKMNTTRRYDRTGEN